MDVLRTADRRSGSSRVRIGSDEHKVLFCRMLLDTHDPYKPAVIPWPRLDWRCHA